MRDHAASAFSIICVLEIPIKGTYNITGGGGQNVLLMMELVLRRSSATYPLLQQSKGWSIRMEHL